MSYENYTIERLEQDLATVEEWLADEITKHDRCTDEETKKYLAVRVRMYENNVNDIKKALEVFSSKADGTV